ncbi:hypothetical protein [Tenacibaculum maritimum]|uniref:hypothetical protein n=1 Tax=Tenacibaculum maritimum TaxID=107401 RepID=UPI002308112D|nr:hypothetical protein [Tenacibaculum maritimum]MDB0603518.1 hypothetical protein [Tenacibaculum maritimum]MDB0612507.1 hypothetical protein [Tenacibaculum maritimum]
MKYPYFLLLSFVITVCSCNTASDLQAEFNCNHKTSYSNLKKHADVRGLFNMKIPKHWKTKLYYDNTQSSIYTADTTKSLTKSTLIDVTIIHNPINFDVDFQKKIEKQSKAEQLHILKSRSFSFFKRASYFNLAKGKRGKYNYHILNLFIKTNPDNFMHIKTEVYGDSLVDKRFCEAIKLIELIELNQ